MAVNDYDFFSDDPFTTPQTTVNADLPDSQSSESVESSESPALVEFPIPQADYGKNGKLKKLRGRMLKKLLKYEFEYLLPPVLIACAVVLFSAVLLGVQIRTMAIHNANVSAPLFTLFIALYAFSAMALTVFPLGIAYRRMEKNFFKGEGAVTFSIPASAEEHLFAKHIATVIAELVGLAVLFLSAVLLVWIGGGDGIKWEKPLFTLNGEYSKASTFFFVVEAIVFFAELVVLIPVAVGACCCFTQRYSGRKNWLVWFFVCVGLNALLSVSAALFISTGVYKILQTELGVHLFIWFQLLCGAGLTLLLYLYERRTITKNINC